MLPAAEAPTIVLLVVLVTWLPNACAPITIVFSPTVNASAALQPMAIFWLLIFPVTFLNASVPIATFLIESTLFPAALTPIAILSDPCVSRGHCLMLGCYATHRHLLNIPYPSWHKDACLSWYPRTFSRLIYSNKVSPIPPWQNYVRQTRMLSDVQMICRHFRKTSSWTH